MLTTIKRKVSITLVSLALSYISVFGVAEVGSYFYIRERLINYSRDILVRSDTLIYQIKDLDRQRDELSFYPPCSGEYVDVLRQRLWPYPLIKDIAYVKEDKVFCSALWGQMKKPLILDVFKNKIIRDGYTWVFDAEIARNITADILYTDNFAITVSPFAFSRFWYEAEKLRFNAIVGDYSHENHFFKIGFDVNKLERVENKENLSLSFIVVKSCSIDNNICVLAGTQFLLLKYQSYYFLHFLLFISFVIAALNYALINNILENKKTLAAKLESAMLNNQLSLVYQPIHKVNDRRVAGIEALLRWNDEKLGYIAPDVFIPLAEKHGIIDKVSIYVIEKAIRECREILADGSYFLSLNVTCSDVCSSHFRQCLINTLEKENISASAIVLEITERQSARIDMLQNAIKIYKDAGFLFALDDFGTGHSNLNWLTSLDVDEIKVDKSITDSIGNQSLNKNILPGLVKMFKDIPKVIVFEGVESEEQYHFLQRNLPNSYAQGWYFSKGLALNDLMEYLAR